MFLALCSATPLAIWLYLLTARGGYWRMKKHLLPTADRPIPSRTIVAVVPARNEADVIADAITSLLTQALTVPIRVVLVDDGSNDGTADAARTAALKINRSEYLTIIDGEQLPTGWTGKLWAVSQGIEHAARFHPEYLLLTDSDIRHAPSNIGSLLAFADAHQLDLASVMVRLATVTFAEQLLIPAFVYFFLQLYPPNWIADTGARTAGAAGGCMLIRSSMMRSIGGIQSIAGEVIDDCALAGLVKRKGGKVWLGLSINTVGLRSYGGFAGVGNMISRSAFNQLRHSTSLLALTLVGLFVTYLLPPLLLLSRRRSRRMLGGAACLVMARTYVPIVSLYRRPKISVISLPVVALFYAGATLLSAIRFWAGAGGKWKGRIQDRRTDRSLPR